MKGTLDVKDYKSIDMVFPFIVEFNDRAADYVEQAPLIAVYIAYSNLFCSLIFDKTAAAQTSVYRSEIGNRIVRLK